MRLTRRLDMAPLGVVEEEYPRWELVLYDYTYMQKARLVLAEWCGVGHSFMPNAKGSLDLDTWADVSPRLCV